MPKYLALAQLQTYVGGIDTSDALVPELLALIGAAEAAVDAYCATEHQPRAWFQQTRFEGVWKRIPLLSTPASVSTVDRVQIQVGVTAGTGAPVVYSIDPTTVQVDVDSDWLQLTTLGNSMPSVGISSGGAVPLVLLDYHTAWYTVQTGEQLYPGPSALSFGGTRAFWAASVTQAANIAPFGPFPAPANVYVGGVLQDAGYTIDYPNGLVNFIAAPTGAVTVDYVSTIPDALRDATRLTAMELLSERAANTAGLAGVGALGVGGQLTATRRKALDLPSPAAKALLRQYRNPGII